MMNQVYLIPTYSDEYDEYGLGSWLKGNIGNIMQGVGSIASLFPGVGTLVGTGLNAIGGMVQGGADKNAAEKQSEEDILNENKNMLAKNRLNGISNSANIPTFKKGGHLPEGNSTSKEADEFMKQFPEEMAMGEKVEYEHTGNQKLAQRIAADHVKDYLKMTGTPGYYSAMKQAGISDELNKMKKGGYFEYKNGGVYITPDKKKHVDAWTKKHGMSMKDFTNQVMALGGKLDKIGNLSSYADGGKKEPIYPIQYGKTRSFAGSNYVFDPTTPATNNYYDPTNVINKGMSIANTPRILPSMVGYSPGFVDYNENTSLPPAGYRNISGQDTTYNYRKEYKTPTGRDTVSYEPGTREDVANAMHLLNNPTGKDATNPNIGVPDPKWHTADKGVSAYYEAIGKKRPPMFAEGGSLDTSFLTEYKSGGTHEESPHGGIPVGGKARVEEGEYRFDDPDSGESYIFSNRF